MSTARKPSKSRVPVYVTGIGCVTPIGRGVREFWDALLSGHQGAAPVQAFDTEPYRTAVGCEVKEFPGAEPLPLPASQRAAQLAFVASREAMASAGLEDGAGVSLSIGSTMGELNFLDRLSAFPADPDGYAALPWEEAFQLGAASITETVADALGLDGPTATLPAACSAGNYAIGQAVDWLRGGAVDIAIAGGAEAFSEAAYAGFSRLGAMSPDLCRPFDANRKGLLLGEGAGFVVLESEESVRRRGAEPLARLLGYGLSCDAHHITGPHPEGAGAAKCMENAMRDAEIGRDAVEYICCHGTGTKQNDRIETKAIRQVMGPHADEIPVSSIKALTGHMMGAASSVEAIACVEALRSGVLPPTWNHEEPDPECDLDVLPNAPREKHVRTILNNSYAFGGNNACVVLGKV